MSDNESQDEVEEKVGESPSVEGEASPAEEERRRTYRLNKVLGATLTTSEGDSKATRLFVIDISTTGFRATDHQPPSEKDYEISIVLVKDQEPFMSKMRVVWVKELTVSGMYQMGCEFVDPPAEQADKLKAFIETERGKTAPTSKTPDFGRPWTMIT